MHKYVKAVRTIVFKKYACVRYKRLNLKSCAQVLIKRHWGYNGNENVVSFFIHIYAHISKHN